MKMSLIQKRYINRPENAGKKIPFLEVLLRVIPVGEVATALEVGCGPGYLSAHLCNEHGIRVVGTDVDPDEIRFARSVNAGCERLSFEEADATALPFDNSEFDMVFSHMILHHIPAWRDALSEMTRVLKPRGYYLFHDLTYSKLLTTVFKPVLKSHAFYSMESVKAALADMDMSLLHEEPQGTYFHNQFTEYNIAFQKLGALDAGTHSSSRIEP